MDKPDINIHFKRESKIMIWVCLAPILIGLFFSFLLPYILPVTKTDICLDNGGSFDYENCRCDYSNNHPVKEKHLCK